MLVQKPLQWGECSFLSYSFLYRCNGNLFFLLLMKFLLFFSYWMTKYLLFLLGFFYFVHMQGIYVRIVDVLRMFYRIYFIIFVALFLEIKNKKNCIAPISKGQLARLFCYFCLLSIGILCISFFFCLLYLCL